MILPPCCPSLVIITTMWGAPQPCDLHLDLPLFAAHRAFSHRHTCCDTPQEVIIIPVLHGGKLRHGEDWGDLHKVIQLVSGRAWGLSAWLPRPESPTTDRSLCPGGYSGLLASQQPTCPMGISPESAMSLGCGPLEMVLELGRLKIHGVAFAVTLQGHLGSDDTPVLGGYSGNPASSSFWSSCPGLGVLDGREQGANPIVEDLCVQ